MAKYKKFSSCNLELASFIVGVIGLIWSASILVISVISIDYVPDIQDLIAKIKQYYTEHLTQEKYESDDIWCIHLDYVSNWLQWIIVSLGSISICKFMANGALMYGITEKEPSPIKWWLIIGCFEIFLIIWACIFELFIFISCCATSNVYDREMRPLQFGLHIIRINHRKPTSRKKFTLHDVLLSYQPISTADSAHLVG